LKFQARTNEKRQLEVRWDLINTYVSRWKPGTFLTLEITRKADKNSKSQRAFYFGHILPQYAEKAGYDIHERYLFHTQLKFRFFEGFYAGQKEKQPYLDEFHVPRNVPAVFADESDFDVPFKKRFIDWVVMRAAHEGHYIETE
jgi:hypothetical protein